MSEPQPTYLTDAQREMITRAADNTFSDNERIKLLARSVIELVNEVDRLKATNAKLSNALALTLEFLEDKAPLGMTYHEMIEAARAALREAS